MQQRHYIVKYDRGNVYTGAGESQKPKCLPIDSLVKGTSQSIHINRKDTTYFDDGSGQVIAGSKCKQTSANLIGFLCDMAMAN